jgi:hypothetical protein
VVIIWVAANSGGNKSTTGSTASNPATTPAQSSAAPASQQPAKSTFAHFGDGTQVVGKDVQPGSYRTRQGSAGCYYARLKGFSGGLSDIASNDNTDSPAVVTILPGDKGFKTQDCGTWTADLSQITKSQTAFDDGIFIVGTDMAPGTYKSSGLAGCYWARLTGFTGDLGETAANDNTDSAAVVTIASADKGFKSSGCGSWTKVG